MVAPASLVERRYISRYARDDIGLIIYVGGELTNADGDVTLSMVNANTQVEVFTGEVAELVTTGTYGYIFTSAQTSEPGDYDITWSYDLDSEPQTYVTYIEVGQAAPAYDMLPVVMKDVVEQAWVAFADGFDSAEGGPNLQSYFQTNFNRGRLAQLLQQALDGFNGFKQPYTTFTLFPEQNQFPVAAYPGFLDQALTVEIIKHLMRSYVEQPVPEGVATARLDRRDYMDRWGRIYDMEKESLDQAAETIKMQYMNLGRPKVLVAGGVYGNYSPTRMSLSAAARPRYWSRWY